MQGADEGRGRGGHDHRRASIPGRRSAAAFGVILSLAIAGCGNAPSSTRGVSFGTAQPSGSAAPTLSAALPGDSTVPLAPTLYGPGSPCAGVTTSTGPAAAPPCAVAWLPYAPTTIPGQNIVSSIHLPSTAIDTAGVTPAQAATVGQAFESTLALLNYGYTTADPGIIAVADGNPVYLGDDPIYRDINSRRATPTSIPACFWPQSVRIAQLSPAAQSTLTRLGWPEPSGSGTVAVIATFNACPGVTMTTTEGTTSVQYGTPTAESDVFTGQVEGVGPMTSLFVINGYSPCSVMVGLTNCGVIQ